MSYKLFLFFLFTFLSFGSYAEVSCRDYFRVPFFSPSEADEVYSRVQQLSWQIGVNKDIGFFQKQILKIKHLSQSKKITHLLTTDDWGVEPLFIQDVYIGEEHRGHHVREVLFTRVPYLREFERAFFEWTLDAEGPVQVVSGARLSSSLHALFVVGVDGKIYIKHTDDSYVNFKHSSFFAGTPVLFAGTIYITPRGDVLHMTSNSGHYQPDREHFEWVQRYLKSKGWKFQPDCCVHHE